MRELLETGIPGLDLVLGGGIPFGYSWLVEGENGIGKTTLALQFIHAIHRFPDERGMYVTFIELPEELHRFARNFGWDLKALEAEGRLKVLAISPALFLQELLDGGSNVRRLMDEFMPTRLVIDSVTDLRLYLVTQDAFRTMLEALLNLFRRRQITTLLIQDVGPDNPPSGLIRRVADINMIMQWQPVGDGSLMDRAFLTPKVRGRDHYNSYVLFEIDHDGIIAVPPDYETFPRVALESVSHIPPSGLTGGFSSGIHRLDQLLGGNLPFQTTWLYSFDETSYYPDPYMPLFTQAIADGASVFFLRSGRHTFQEAATIIAPYGFSFERLAEQNRIVIGELFQQPVPAPLASSVVSAAPDQTAEQYALDVIEALRTLLEVNPDQPHLSLMFTDALVRRFGANGLLTFVDRLVGAIDYPATTHVFLANEHELTRQEYAFLGFMSRGIIRLWKNDGYQYLQVTKTPRNSSSPPTIIVRSSHYPYLKLLVRR